MTTDTHVTCEATLRIVPLKGNKIEEKTLNLLAGKIIDMGEKFGLDIVVGLDR